MGLSIKGTYCFEPHHIHPPSHRIQVHRPGSQSGWTLHLAIGSSEGEVRVAQVAQARESGTRSGLGIPSVGVRILVSGQSHW